MKSRKTTKFGMTTVYPEQKPEDIFTRAELEDWARRNGWKQPVRIEKFGGENLYSSKVKTREVTLTEFMSKYKPVYQVKAKYRNEWLSCKCGNDYVSLVVCEDGNHFCQCDKCKAVSLPGNCELIGLSNWAHGIMGRWSNGVEMTWLRKVDD